MHTTKPNISILRIGIELLNHLNANFYLSQQLKSFSHFSINSTKKINLLQRFVDWNCFLNNFLIVSTCVLRVYVCVVWSHFAEVFKLFVHVKFVQMKIVYRTEQRSLSINNVYVLSLFGYYVKCECMFYLCYSIKNFHFPQH